MKFINIEDIPGRVPPKHYDLLGRTLADESKGVKDFRVAYTPGWKKQEGAIPMFMKMRNSFSSY